MIEEFCTKLKDKRIEMGLDIEETVEKTKLHPSIIRSIESANFKGITPIYLKGYIKIYASFLGIDFKEELSKLKFEKDQKKSVKLKEFYKETKNEPKSEKADFSKIITPTVKKKIILLITALVIIFVVWFVLASFIGFIKSRMFQAPKNKFENTLSKKETTSDNFGTGIQAVQEINATLRVRRDCFVRVKVDGGLVFEGVLRSGVVESWQAKDEIEFKISDGSSIDLEVNGTLYPPLSKIRKPIKSLRITKEGIFTE